MKETHIERYVLPSEELMLDENDYAEDRFERMIELEIEIEDAEHDRYATL